jgi:4-hydroxy-tetrahydrodipicolinate synthase
MDRAQRVAALHTISAIPVTPFDTDGRVDWRAYERVVDRLVDGGITVITPNGNTGEFYALAAEECDRAVEVTVARAGRAGGVLVMPGTGHDVATAIALGRTAQRAGAQALMVHQPVHPYQSPEGWVAYHAAIAEALPEMGIVCYVRDPNVTAAMLSRLAEQPNVVGVKYAVPNPLQFASIVAEVGAAVGQDRLAWVCGLAEGWAPFFWPGGAVGFTSGLVNVDTAAPFELLHKLQAGDYAGAMALWRRVKPFEDLRARRNAANNVPVVKEALAQLGVCGRTVRPPISEVPPGERAEVADLLATMGIWHLASVGA